jgi:catechol 2,3-dioxygenase-like lactoylglutathione lyase family enzyme
VTEAPTGTDASSGVGFVGFRTDRFAEMLTLFRDQLGLPIVRSTGDGAVFGLGPDAELHVYGSSDDYHAFFTTGPVVGLRVGDIAATRRRLVDAELEMLTEIDDDGANAWFHFRAPDGTVLEVIGPGSSR